MDIIFQWNLPATHDIDEGHWVKGQGHLAMAMDSCELDGSWTTEEIYTKVTHVFPIVRPQTDWFSR